jgi:hypothetical protein
LVGVSGLEAQKSALGDLAQAVAQSANLRLQRLRAELRRLWSDSWIAGAKDASDHGAQPPADDPLEKAVQSVDWAEWTPGAPLPEPPGIENVDQQVGALISGLSDTTRAQIVQAVNNFVNGRVAHVPWTSADVAALAAQIAALLDDPNRAVVIARTEVNRAMTQGSADLFARAGIAMFNLLDHPTACQRCKDIAAANPHPVSDVSALPPIHPQCRCSIGPA